MLPSERLLTGIPDSLSHLSTVVHDVIVSSDMSGIKP